MKKQVLALFLAFITAAHPSIATACRSAIIGKESTADGRVISWWAFQWGWGHRLYAAQPDDPVNRDAPLGPLGFTCDNNNVGQLLGKTGNGVNESGLFVSCNINNGMQDGRKSLAYFGARAFMSRCSTQTNEGTPIILDTSGNINGTNRYKIPGVIMRRSVIGY